MDKFEEFLNANQFVLMKTDLFEKDRLITTPYYINPFGEIGVKDNGTFKYLETSVAKRGDKDGYERINLNINGKKLGKFVHRLVAQTFIPNPCNLPCVNHKNRNILDNTAGNLEWVTVLQNCQHEKKTRHLKKPSPTYPILQIEEVGKKHFRIIGEYATPRELPKYTVGFEKKVDKKYILACCKKYGNKKTYRNYVWIYKKDLEKYKNESGLAPINV